MSENNEDIGHLIIDISHKIKIYGDEGLKQHGITFTQLKIMGFLEKNQGTVTQKSIENFMKVSHPTIVGILSRMARDGYIESNGDSKDHRQKVIHLSEKAKQLLNNIDKGRINNEKILTNGFSDKEIDAFQSFLFRVQENLSSKLNRMKGETND